MKLAIYVALVILIAMVSVFDAYLNLKYPVTIHSEENPIALFILANTDLASLICFKFAGTVFAVIILLLIYGKKYAYPVVSGLAACQVCVMLYMLLA